jgi:hypothetical protein
LQLLLVCEGSKLDRGAKRIAGTFTRHPLTTSGKRQSLLKTNEAAVALFLAIRASRTKRQVLSSVARLLLKDQELDAFEALLVAYGSLERQRSDLAHGLFGHAED